MPATPAPRERDVPAMAAPMNTPMPNLPAPPPQWQNESMRQWLQTKAEEYRREQEEERTRQESYRLDQRRVEQSMLRESLKAGVPPCMVPLIFASMGGGYNLQWIQQHMSQLHGCSSQPHILPQQASHTMPQSQPQPQQYLPPQQHQQKQEQKPAPLPSQPTSSPVAHHHRPQYTQSQSMPPPSQMPAAGQSVAPENPCQSRMIPPNPYASQLSPNIKAGHSSQPEPLSPSSTASSGFSKRYRTERGPITTSQTTAGPRTEAWRSTRIRKAWRTNAYDFVEQQHGPGGCPVNIERTIKFGSGKITWTEQQQNNDDAQFAGDHNGRSHGNYPGAVSRDDSQGGRGEGGGGGGGHELSASYNSRPSSFNDPEPTLITINPLRLDHLFTLERTSHNNPREHSVHC
ncbi:predicted protein [Histoplasma mississippiense (nom. inval.)]|uniref:predicted protein n=1 Tax=Ajellomyces capsulatus (strain NAm1 / WU24) TaxID=2059318 RepID=UPI000157CA46|nr:predicted protein [Histoplasma mississippiense (nom. inval.)]EDN09504.1 predicted protein [Histoplasma mississippiense (nom. inval.)]